MDSVAECAIFRISRKEKASLRVARFRRQFKCPLGTLLALDIHILESMGQTLPRKLPLQRPAWMK